MEVDHQTFDWIFFAIVGIPLIFGLIELFNPDWLERIIGARRDERGVIVDRSRR